MVANYLVLRLVELIIVYSDQLYMVLLHCRKIVIICEHTLYRITSQIVLSESFVSINLPHVLHECGCEYKYYVGLIFAATTAFEDGTKRQIVKGNETKCNVLVGVLANAIEYVCNIHVKIRACLQLFDLETKMFGQYDHVICLIR